MKLLKKLSPFEISLILVVLGVHLYASFADGYNFPNIWFIRDDAYYYFKVAQNISEGYGSTFDRLNVANGYHPLWMLVNIPVFALARFDLILPLRILLMLNAALHAATAVFMYRAILRALSKPVAMFAAAFWAFNGYLHYAFYRTGLETSLAAFFIALLMERLGAFESVWRKEPLAPKRMTALALLATLVMFSRLDLVFLAFLTGAYIVFRGRPLRYLLPLDVVALFFSMTASVALRVGFPAYNGFAASAVSASLLALAVKLPVFYWMGLYQHPRAGGFLELIKRTLLAALAGGGISFGLVAAAMQLGFFGQFSRFALLYDAALTLALILLIRLFAFWFANQPAAKPQSPLMELRAHWREWLREGWLYYRVVGGTLAAYMLFNKIFFGVSSPVSGLVKRWWGTLLHTIYDNPAGGWADFLGLGYFTPYNAWAPVSHTLLWMAKKIKPLYPGSNTEDERYYIVIAVVVPLVLLLLFLNARLTRRAFAQMALIPLLAGGGLQMFSYTATAYGGAKEWYWITQVFISIFILATVAQSLLRPLQKFKPLRPILEAAALLLCVYYARDLNFFILNNMTRGRVPPETPYMDVVAYLENHTRPGAVIGMTGGGNVGYFIKERTIVNMDGLINSYDYFQALKRGEAPQYLYQRGMRVVFSNIRLLSFSPYEGQFQPYLVTFSSYGNKNLMWLFKDPVR